MLEGRRQHLFSVSIKFKYNFTKPLILSLYSAATGKPLALGSRLNLEAQSELCSYLKSLLDPRPVPVNPTPVPITPTRSQHEHVEYRSRWVPERWACTFHVVCINFGRVWFNANPFFWWNLGLGVSKSTKFVTS